MWKIAQIGYHNKKFIHFSYFFGTIVNFISQGSNGWMVQMILLIQLKDFTLNSQYLWRNKILKENLKSMLSGININRSYLPQNENKTETGSTSVQLLFVSKRTLLLNHDMIRLIFEIFNNYKRVKKILLVPGLPGKTGAFYLLWKSNVALEDGAGKFVREFRETVKSCSYNK